MSDPREFFLLRWLSYPRTLIGNILLLFYTPIHALIIVIISMMTKSLSLGTSLLRAWSAFVLSIYGVKVKVKGLENIPEEGALFIFNHTSHMDIPVIHHAIPQNIRFGAKIELFHIPMFGAAMKATGVLPITRSSREEVLKIYQKSIARVHQGESFVLAPEGTRQSGQELGRFKAGPFIFAINAQCPIVPVVLQDVWKVLPKNGLLPNWGSWQRTVEVEILPALSTKDVDIEQRRELQEQARKMMADRFRGAKVMSTPQPVHVELTSQV